MYRRRRHWWRRPRYYRKSGYRALASSKKRKASTRKKVPARTGKRKRTSTKKTKSAKKTARRVAASVNALTIGGPVNPPPVPGEMANNFIFGRNKGMFPDLKRVAMRYEALLNVERPPSPVSAGAPVTFRMNSIWDPEYATGITQLSANGYEQWKLFYQRYCVTGAKVTTTFRWKYNGGSTWPGTGQVGYLTPTYCAAIPSSAPLIDPNNYPLSKLQEVYGSRFLRLLKSSGDHTATIVTKYSMRKFWGIEQVPGVNPVSPTSNSMGAAFDSNPNSIAYIHLFVYGDPMAEQLMAPISVEVKIRYIVRLITPINLALSDLTMSARNDALRIQLENEAAAQAAVKPDDDDDESFDMAEDTDGATCPRLSEIQQLEAKLQELRATSPLSL